MQNAIQSNIVDYLKSSAPTACELDESPFICDFWSLDELEQLNQAYEVPEYAPGYYGFATSGGGEMFAIDPAGQVVCLPFIGMEPSAAIIIATNWPSFITKLREYKPI
jgi:hypothetical protein